MKILVTGGAGFIGSHVVDELLERGDEPVVIDNLISGHRENIPEVVKFYQTDIKDLNKLKEIFRSNEVEVVFHLAAQKSVTASVSDPIHDAEENVIGSLNVFEAAKDVGVKKIVFASTGGALYGDAQQIPTPEDHPIAPLSPYGIAKYSVEHYLRFYREVYGLNSSVLRFANVYGPRQDPKGEAGVVAIFCQRILAGESPTIYGNGEQTRDYIYVKDVAKAFIATIEADKAVTVNIGTGREASVLKLVDELARYSGADIKPKFVPARPGELSRSCLDVSEAKNSLNWTPSTTLEEGLAETYAWFKDRLSSR